MTSFAQKLLLFANSGVAIVYSLYASFASGKTAETGTLTYTENDGSFTATGGKLSYPAQTTPAWGDLSVRSQQISFTDDTAWCIFAVVNESTRSNSHIGWFPTTTISDSPRLGVYFTASQVTRNAGGQNSSMGILSAANTDYPIAVIARDTDSDANAENYQAFAKIGNYWRRLWSLAGQNDASAYAGFGNLNSVGTLDSLKVTSLASSLFDAGVSLSGAVSAGTSFTLPDGDFLLQFTLTTVPSANSVLVRFNQLDANNYWQLGINSSGTLALTEVIAGASNARASGGTASNGSVINLTADANNIYGFIGANSAFTYASGHRFRRETAASLNSLGTGGAVSDLSVYKRHLKDFVGYSSNSVTNGTFATDTDWYRDGGWTISGGKANHTATGSESYLIQQNVMVQGEYYELSFDAVVSAGSVTLATGYLMSIVISATGSYTLYAPCIGSEGLDITASSTFTGSLDNIVVRKLNFNADSLSAQLERIHNG